jgi:Fungal specific transcription factor domain
VYAFTAFGQPTDPTFLPLSNAYVPIDLLDIASTHATLAHSASHIAYLRNQPTPVSALSHKSAAIKLINDSLNDPKIAVSDGILAAVLRLLTFEVRSIPNPKALTSLSLATELLGNSRCDEISSKRSQSVGQTTRRPRNSSWKLETRIANTLG